jgi:toxin secretion/phage lysis holin
MRRFKMGKGEFVFSSITAAVLTPVAIALGGWDPLLKVLVSFVVIDYLTGVINAICKKKLSSEVGFFGLLKKVVIFFLVFVAVQLDTATGSEVFRTLTILFYISNEGISILENTSALGVPYPQQLKDILEQLRKKSEDPEGSKANGQ